MCIIIHNEIKNRMIIIYKKYNFSPVFYMNVLKIFNGDQDKVNPREVLYVTSRVRIKHKF